MLQYVNEPSNDPNIFKPISNKAYSTTFSHIQISCVSSFSPENASCSPLPSYKAPSSLPNQYLSFHTYRMSLHAQLGNIMTPVLSIFPKLTFLMPPGTAVIAVDFAADVPGHVQPRSLHLSVFLKTPSWHRFHPFVKQEDSQERFSGKSKTISLSCPLHHRSIFYWHQRENV